MKKLQVKKHHCEECGALLSEREYEEFDGLCKKCYNKLIKDERN